jgi:GT2 family glycosyltransferase
MSRGWGYREGQVSVVICCYNRLDLTEICVKSILTHPDGVNEIVLVDNNSTDGTAEWIYNVDADVPIQAVTMSENVGWGRGANAGAQLAEGEFLLHLNNDTEVHDKWLPALLAEMGPDVAGVAGMLINPDGTLQHAGITVFRDSNGIVTAENIKTEQPAGDVACISLAAALVRAEAWQQTGGINPRYYNGYEDVDWCLRARKHGWRLRYTPESIVMHHAHASGAERWAHTRDNVCQLHEDWSGSF